MQSDLYEIMKWSNANLLFLNFDKCYTISFSKRSDKINFNYYLESKIHCKRVNIIKDLGVIFDSKLTFIDHLNYIVSRASRSWGFVYRNTKSFKNPNVCKYLYLSLTKSLIMYASTIWRPIGKNNMDRLERIQHRALRHIAFLSNNPMSWFDHDYTSVAETFSMASVSSSMIASDFVLVYKIMSNHIMCTELRNRFPIYSPIYVLRNRNPFYPEMPSSRQAEANPINI